MAQYPTFFSGLAQGLSGLPAVIRGHQEAQREQEMQLQILERQDRLDEIQGEIDRVKEKERQYDRTITWASNVLERVKHVTDDAHRKYLEDIRGTSRYQNLTPEERETVDGMFNTPRTDHKLFFKYKKEFDDAKTLEEMQEIYLEMRAAFGHNPAFENYFGKLSDRLGLKREVKQQRDLLDDPALRKQVGLTEEQTRAVQELIGAGINIEEAKKMVLKEEPPLTDWEKFRKYPDLYEEYKGIGKKPSRLEAKLENIRLAYPGATEEQVRRLAAGTIRGVTDPITGEHVLIDLGTGERLPIGEEPTDEIAKKELTKANKDLPPDVTLWDIAYDATGPWSAALSVLSVPGAWLNLGVAKEILQARQYLVLTEREFIRTMMLSPRYAVLEQELLRKRVKLQPAIFDSGAILRERMKAQVAFLKTKLEQEIRISKNKTIPVADRKRALKMAETIKNYIRQVGIPEEDERITGRGITFTPEEQELLNQWLDKEPEAQLSY